MSTRYSGDELAALVAAMLESSLDAIVTIDAAGRVLTFNRAAEAIFGYRAEEALGRNVAELIIPPSLRPRHHDALARHLQGGERTILDRRVELTGRRADGSEFPVELTVTRVPIDGPPIFTGYLRDITERKRAEQELRRSRTWAVESADRERRRIERNLHDGAQQRLIGIGLLLQRLTLDPDLPATLAQLVDVAQDETGHALEELRELARGIHPASLTEAGLASALRGLALRTAVQVTVTAPDERLPDSVEIALYYVAAEALANVARHARASAAEVDVEVAADHATLRVSDDGVGGAAQRRGTGLAGLSDRVEAMGGRLAVESPPGVGTTVTAVVPLR